METPVPEQQEKNDVMLFLDQYEKEDDPFKRLALIEKNPGMSDSRVAELLKSLFFRTWYKTRDKKSPEFKVGEFALEQASRYPRLDPAGGHWWTDIALQALAENGHSSENALVEILTTLRNDTQETRREQEGYLAALHQRSLEEEIIDGDFDFTLDHEGDLRDQGLWDVYDENFHEVNFIIQTLGTIGGEKSTDAIIELIKEDQVFLYKHSIADALSRINPDAAAKKLYALLQDDNPQVRRDASKILNRLELGRIGISEEGVAYFDRLYDLGAAWNNPNYSAQRLTANGDVGIFDGKTLEETPRLIGFFKLGDLSNPAQRITAEVLNISYEMLFTPTTEEPDEDQALRERLLEEFKSHYFTFYNDRFFEQTGVRFNNLSFKEQGWLLHFLSQSEEADQARVYDFVARYGEDGFRTFLAVEHSEQLGNTILTLGEQLSYQHAQVLFQKFGAMMDDMKHIDDYLEATFGDDPSCTPEVKVEIAERILERGARLLESFAQALEHSPEDKTSSEQLSNLLIDLERIETGSALFLSTLKTLRRRDNHKSLETFKDAEVQIRSIENVSPQDIAEMRALYEKNYTSTPGLQKVLLGSFDRAVRTQETQHDGREDIFFVFRHGGHIRTFLRSTQKNETTAYLGSFNADESYAHAELGLTVFEETLHNQMTRWERIEADCDSRNPISMRYIELGFVATSTYQFEEVPALAIEWNRNQAFSGKSMSKEDIIEQARHVTEFSTIPQDKVVVVTTTTVEELPLSWLNNGYVMSRFFRDKGNVYGIFEKGQSTHITER